MDENTPNAGEMPETQEQPAQTAAEMVTISVAELAEIRAALKKANGEAAKYRKTAEQADAERKAKEEAEMTALDKANKRAAELEAERDAALSRAQETAIRAELKSAAQAANFQDPADVLRFVDREKITVSDTGDVEGVQAAVDALAKAKPYLLKANDKAALPKGTPAQGQRPNGNKPEQPQPKPSIRF